MSALIVFLMSIGVFAQGPAKKPVSISYEAVLQCFPEVEDASLSQQVDLNRLRERMELFLVTDRKRLEKRVVKFRDETGVLRRVTLEEKTDPKKPLLGQQLYAQWEMLTEGGASTPWDPGLPKKFTILDVNSILAKSAILSDDRVDFDTKLKGFTLRVRRSQNKVVEIRLENAPNQWVLSCEDRAQAGAICICTKKAPASSASKPVK